MEHHDIDFMGMTASYDEAEFAFMSSLKERLAIDREGTLRELEAIHRLKATFPGSQILPEKDSRAGAIR
jgi:hypothetical protein